MSAAPKFEQNSQKRMPIGREVKSFQQILEEEKRTGNINPETLKKIEDRLNQIKNSESTMKNTPRTARNLRKKIPVNSEVHHDKKKEFPAINNNKPKVKEHPVELNLQEKIRTETNKKLDLITNTLEMLKSGELEMTGKLARILNATIKELNESKALLANQPELVKQIEDLEQKFNI